MNAGLLVAAAGHAYWLAGNVREARTGAIERWAADPPPSVLAPGSPPRYYAPAVVPTFGALCLGLAGVPAGARSTAYLGAAASAVGVAVTVGLVHTVNLPLLRRQIAPEHQPALIARWYRWNRIRVIAVGVAVAALARTAAA